MTQGTEQTNTMQPTRGATLPQLIAAAKTKMTTTTEQTHGKATYGSKAPYRVRARVPENSEGATHPQPPCAPSARGATNGLVSNRDPFVWLRFSNTAIRCSGRCGPKLKPAQHGNYQKGKPAVKANSISFDCGLGRAHVA